MAYASTAEARDAMLALFKTAWDAQTPPVPIVIYDDMRSQPPTDSESWARVNVQHANTVQATLGGVGGRRFRKNGVLTVQVFTPLAGGPGSAGGGLTVNDALVKIAVDAFEGRSTRPDGVEFRGVTPREVGQSGAWFQTNVIVLFRYDIIK